MAKMVKKAQNGIIGKIKSSWKKAGEDLKQADRDYKTSDSLRKLPMTGKTMKEKYENSKANRLKADSLFKAAEKRSVGGMKKGGKMIKKAKNGTSFGMLSVKAGVDNNPNPTAADRIAGAKKKMQYGGEAASMVPMMKKGGMKKKYKNGGTLAAPTKGGVSMQLGSYTRQIGKNYTGKNVVNKGAKAKMGKSVGKCKNGC
jgi:hypothetical protein